MCMAKFWVSEACVLIVTGGDDNGLAITRLTYITDILACATLLVPRAHTSAITAIACLKDEDLHGGTGSRARYRLFTCGPDQRLKSWNLTINLESPGVEGIELTRSSNTSSTVADVSGMVQIEGSSTDNGIVIVAGIGIEARKV